MSRVHSTNGKDEVILEKLLWHSGIRYRKNYKELPGKPDIAITKQKVAVFIDGKITGTISRAIVTTGYQRLSTTLGTIKKLMKSLNKWAGLYFVSGLSKC